MAFVGMSSRLTSMVSGAPLRRIDMEAVLPFLPRRSSTLTIRSMPVSGVPSTESMRSFFRRPACSDGESLRILVTTIVSRSEMIFTPMPENSPLMPSYIPINSSRVRYDECGSSSLSVASIAASTSGSRSTSST